MPDRCTPHSEPERGAEESGLSLRCLFLDLNSYFASVEQHLDPSLRGKPVAVVPVMAESSSCIAASYEAKAFGVRTGTRVREAREMCPGIVFVKAQHRRYVEIHHEVVAAVESVLPVEGVFSIDEMSARLLGDERRPERAKALAEKIKAAISERIGPSLRASIGIAPNRFLAKIASDMMKPDGLVIIRKEDLPDALLALKLTDLAGIGNRMEEHLRRAGITSVQALCDREAHELEAAWGSILGRYWHRWLRGEETDQRPQHRRSVGHQHVLPPDCRNEAGAWGISLRLLHKAASRMRHLGYVAGQLSLTVGYVGQKRGPWGGQFEREERHRPWHGAVRLAGGAQDTLTLNAHLRDLWDKRSPGTPSFIGVTLSELVPLGSVTRPLFEAQQRREKLSHLMDRLDQAHGPMTVYPASMQEARKHGKGGIAFNSIPDLRLPDTLTSLDPEDLADRPEE
jgi:DNA polymerase-4